MYASGKQAVAAEAAVLGLRALCLAQSSLHPVMAAFLHDRNLEPGQLVRVPFKWGLPCKLACLLPRQYTLGRFTRNSRKVNKAHLDIPGKGPVRVPLHAVKPFPCGWGRAELLCKKAHVWYESDNGWWPAVVIERGNGEEQGKVLLITGDLGHHFVDAQKVYVDYCVTPEERVSFALLEEIVDALHNREATAVGPDVLGLRRYSYTSTARLRLRLPCPEPLYPELSAECLERRPDAGSFYKTYVGNTKKLATPFQALAACLHDKLCDVTGRSTANFTEALRMKILHHLLSPEEIEAWNSAASKVQQQHADLLERRQFRQVGVHSCPVAYGSAESDDQSLDQVYALSADPACQPADLGAAASTGQPTAAAAAAAVAGTGPSAAKIFKRLFRKCLKRSMKRGEELRCQLSHPAAVVTVKLCSLLGKGTYGRVYDLEVVTVQLDNAAAAPSDSGLHQLTPGCKIAGKVDLKALIDRAVAVATARSSSSQSSQHKELAGGSGSAALQKEYRSGTAGHSPHIIKIHGEGHLQLPLYPDYVAAASVAAGGDVAPGTDTTAGPGQQELQQPVPCLLMYQASGSMTLLLEEVYKLWQSSAKRAADAKHGFTRQQCNAIIKQVLKGVEVMHRGGMIHGDLKPDNILFQSPEHWNLQMLDQQPEACVFMLGDFGLSTVYDLAEPPHRFRGTVGYMAPEVKRLGADQQKAVGSSQQLSGGSEQVLEGAHYGPEVDLFAAGLIWLYLRVGHRPFSYIKDTNHKLSIDDLRSPNCPYTRPSMEDRLVGGVITLDEIDWLENFLDASPHNRMGAALMLRQLF